MTAPKLLLLVETGIVLALFVVGALGVFSVESVARRIAGLAVLTLASVCALAVLGAPQSATLAALLVGAAQCAVGFALMVRLNEAYGAMETSSFDAADANDERDAAP
jgi:NADH:ubiquinone oxidoreductase subunit K